ELASVPPPEALRKPEPVAEEAAGGDVLSELRAMTDRDESSGGLRGDLIGFGVPTAATAKPVLPRPPKDDGDRVGYQTRLSSFVRSGADMTAQATWSPDRRSVRLSVEPVFNTYTRMQQQAQVNNPLIPGGGGR
ncbi:MAG TPA: hypothetical protein VJ739_15600, partial [Gemmataceae bacterium]|nr:hypothetical protein [Gemmataceae bacterium]